MHLWEAELAGLVPPPCRKESRALGSTQEPLAELGKPSGFLASVEPFGKT